MVVNGFLDKQNFAVVVVIDDYVAAVAVVGDVELDVRLL